MEASYEGGQGPEGVVAPWMDGWMDCLLSFSTDFPTSCTEAYSENIQVYYFDLMDVKLVICPWGRT